jgi:pimeloyl-ACP methyl ester carboxylesterase
MGAAIGAMFAGTRPTLVDKLVLLEGLGPLPAEAADAPERLERAAEEALLPPSRTRVFASLDDAALRVIQAAPMEKDSAKRLLERGLKPVEGGFTWRTDPRLRGTTRLRFTEAHVEAFMKRISAPTLAVLADNGWPVPHDLVALRKGYLSQLTVAQVSGRHHVHLDAPELVAPHVLRFLAP